MKNVCIFSPLRAKSKPGADDIQAALAKAHVRALSMSMADRPSDSSVLFGQGGLFPGTERSSGTTPSHRYWETEDSLSAATSDEYSS